MKVSHVATSVRLSITALSLASLFAASGQAQHYIRTDLVSNVPGAAITTDTDLVNAWGLSRSSTSPWWVADNGTGKSTLYNGTGIKQGLVVTVPGSPTGTVFNGTSDFKLPNGSASHFLFASEDGTISAWGGGTSAEIVVNRPPAVYKGLAIASIDGKNYLFATNFHAGRIEVFDSSFQLVKDSADEFKIGMRSIGAEFVPFNVQNIGGNLFIAFAKQDADKHDEVNGAGLGMVAVFRPNGRLLKVFRHGWWLNAPWGLALAPGDFGYFSHALLVGQFGSGQIAAYNIESGDFIGLLEDAAGNPTTIDGLWAISFGNGQNAGPANTLYFAAGPDGESNGLFGMLTALPADQMLGNGK